MAPHTRTPISETIERALARIHPREAAALRLRYAQRLTFREVGEELGLSRERARQIVSRAEKRLAYAIVHWEFDHEQIARDIQRRRAETRRRLKERLERDGRKLSEELDIWRTRER